MSSVMAIPTKEPKSRGASKKRIGFAGALPKPNFMEQLRIEKLRAERSKSELSILLLYPAKKTAFEHTIIQEIFGLLQARTRETDIIGMVDKEIVGVLLPETDKKGAQQVSKKIMEEAGSLFQSVVARTYPDQVFDCIATDWPIGMDLSSLISEYATENAWLRQAIKRGIDIVGSIAGIVLFLPIMVVIAIAIKATSPGPVIFKQVRLGKKGVPFTFYKFRSMYLNTDDRIHREYVENLIKGNHERINQGNREKPLYKIKSDPRVTRIGKIIRKTSMDELPQFFNVLKGDMSLVGPRPAISYEAEKYDAWHLRRILEVKPGITGLWQVEGRSKTTFDDMVRLDIQYIQNWSLMLDIKILIKTLKVVSECGGAM